VITQGIGNRTGGFTSNWIASRPQVIAIGATNIHNEVSPFNSLSFRYEVFAPGGDRRPADAKVSMGGDVVSDAPNSNPDDVMCALGKDRYSFMSGGSAAAPQVAAAAAIVKSYLPAATPAQVRRLITGSTRPSTPTLNVIQSTGGVLSLKALRGHIAEVQSRSR
jgi:subtilisin family serine protease